MADLSITANSVLPGSNADIEYRYRAGAAITAGQSVYLDSSSLWQLADNNVSAILAGSLGKVGIALNPAGAAGQPVAVQTGGDITIGATVAIGQHYAIGDGAGGIADEVDLNTGDWWTLLGYGISTTQLRMQVVITGLQHA